MSWVEIDLNAMADVVQEMTTAIVNAYDNTEFSEPPTGYTDPHLLAENLQRFVAIARQVDRQTDTASPDNKELNELGDLGDYGLSLLAELSEWCETLNMEELKVSIEELSIPIALWASRAVGQFREIDIIVNALTRIANQASDPRFLTELSAVMREISNAVDEDIKADPDKSDPARPWRILNINHGIVATRTHDPKVMEEVFGQLLLRFPDDAADFFKEGMEQMDEVDYPNHVRSVMEKYYHLTNKPTLH